MTRLPANPQGANYAPVAPHCPDNPAGGRQRANRSPSLSCCRRAILFVGAAHDDPERIIRQRPLQGLRFIPRCAHPNVLLLVGRQDHRHRLGMDRLDHRVRCRRQEAVDQVRPRDRLRLGATVAFELGPEPAEGEQRSVLIEREPDDVLFAGRRRSARARS